ncbi:MAG TPA: LytR C-terminal domain-containing protein [Elusimicrobiales bacterium]|nr:LytR C-terminal domain-containing protein [Elusimicrobiales bacterium]
MEQSSRKNQILILAAGGLLVLALAAAHHGSSVAGRLSSGRDVELVLLSRARPMLFVYHPFSRTVNAIRLPARAASAAGSGASACQRAAEVRRLFSRWGDTQAAPVYIESAEPDLEALEELLNGWRSRPAGLLRLLGGLRELRRSEATGLTAYELLLGALELVRLDSSHFIKEDLERVPSAGRAAEEPLSGSQVSAAAAARVEVLNASGKRDLAGRVTKFLRKNGYDVISFGTYAGVERHTKIVNCSGDIEAARGVRSALGLGGREIYSKSGKVNIADVRVILGEDFDDSVLKRGEP